MASKNYKTSKEFEKYNFQKELIENIADDIFELKEKISYAFEGKVRYYRMAQSEVTSFRDFIIGLGLTFEDKDLELINLNLQISKKLYSQNKFEQGVSFLSSAFIILIKILKRNNMVFPVRTKGMSFSAFAKSEMK